MEAGNFLDIYLAIYVITFCAFECLLWYFAME
jgi:hypothetical protein